MQAVIGWWRRWRWTVSIVR